MAGRIDWKTYDYSEGPPKPQRNTNPYSYSKSTNYRTRESSTSSPVNLPAVPDTIANVNVNMNIKANAKTNINPLKHNSPVTKNHLSTRSSPVPAAVLSITSPETQSDYSSKDYFHIDTPESIKEPSSNRSTRKTSTSASTTAAVSPTRNMTQSKLSYRPPGPPILIQAPSYDEMGPMIPTRRRFPIQQQQPEDEEPFDTVVTQQSHPVNSQAVKAIMKKPISPPRLNDHEKVGLRLNVSNNTEEVHLSAKSNFDEIWNEADEQWNEADEEQWNEADEEQQQHYVSDDDDDEEEGQFEFERGAVAGVSTLLTEDLIATATAKTKVGLDGENSTARSILAASVSDDSVAMMDMTRGTNTAPVSILRSRSRFEKDSSFTSADGRSSSVSRKNHPWDQDQKVGESVPMDEVEEEQVAPDEEEDAENTDLSQYEAEDHEVAAATKEHLWQGEQENRTLKRVVEKPNHILRNDNTEVVEREKRRRSRKRADVPQEQDDDSIEHRDGNLKTGDTLRDRTKQAWSKRNQSTGGSAAAGLPGTGFLPSGRNVENAEGRRSLVSFQQGTVHEFEREEAESVESDGATEVTDYTEYDDDDTFAGRSMHSVYTKSNESEAEDFFKDLFFIGSGKGTNPGKREIRYKKEFKQQYKADKKAREEEESSEGEEEEDGNEDDIALEEQSTIDGSSPDEPTIRKRSGELDNDDDEDRDDETISKTDTYDEDEIEADAFTMTYNYCEDILTSLTEACGFKSLKTEEKKKAKSSSSEETNPDEDEFSMVDSFVDYATDAMFPPSKNAFSGEENAKALTDLAINAAKIKHTLQDVKYDELHDLKLQDDVKVIKSSIALPIGLVFAETDVCCWVQKIFVTGNAAVASVGDKLQVGDQLAAINGVTAMHKNVAEICKILAKESGQPLIELTFIRYIGPLRPASNEQQGYEVIDTKLGKSGRFSPIEMAKKISFSRPRSPPATTEEVIKINSKKSCDSTRNKSCDSKARSKSRTKDPEAPKPPLSIQQQVLSPKEAQYCQPVTETETKKKKKIFGFLRRKKIKEQKKK